MISPVMRVNRSRAYSGSWTWETSTISLRAAAFAYLDRLRARDGDRMSYRDLEAFEFEGQRVSLIQRMRGIRVVSGLEAALSILTTYAARPQDRPYEDTEGPDGYWRYKWRGTDPEGYDNVALRRAMELGKPLVWFVGAARGVYVPHLPGVAGR